MPDAKDRYPQLLSLAVHEFRTPASVVSGYLRMVLRDTDPLTDRQRKMLDEADKSFARLMVIVGELSDIGKFDAGTITLARQSLDVCLLVAEVAELVHEARDREVRLDVRGRAKGGSMTGDATRLKAAFHAIFRAILREKAGPATVVADRRIESVDGRRSAVVVIADEASVQAAYDRPPGLFDEFDPRRGGIGLGLPLARRVIEGHGGRIWSPAAREGGDDPLTRGTAIVSLPVQE